MGLAFFQGLLLSFGLIIAIGPQNAYVIRKGLKRRHVFVVATTCFLGDALLIALAAGGVGAIAGGEGTLSTVLTLGGVAFLLWFGTRSFLKARKPKAMTGKEIGEAGSQVQGKGWGSAVWMALALTFLNPHAYLDTLVIIGGVSVQFEMEPRIYFAAGAILASGIWFYAIGYGARLLSNLFQSPKAWQVLDIIIGIIMYTAAIVLIVSRGYSANI